MLPHFLYISVGAATVELVSVSQIKPLIALKWNVSTASLGRMSLATFLGEIIGGFFWSFASDRIGKGLRVLLRCFTCIRP